VNGLDLPSCGMRELSLFSGAGGGLLATTWLLGFKTVCYVEWEPYCASVLKQRIEDGYLRDAPIWDDVQTFDGHPWSGCVDIITAGFPCQPFSQAGRRAGQSDKRNMWPSTIRIIREVRPAWILLENVTGLFSAMDKAATLPHSYYGTILGDLAQSGYDARWRVLSAAEVGAPHKRDRLFILCNDLGNAMLPGLQDRTKFYDGKIPSERNWWEAEPGMGRVADGVAYQVDRLKAVGNGQVPTVVSTAWRLLTQDL